MTRARQAMSVVFALLLVLTACSKGDDSAAKAGSNTGNASDTSDSNSTKQSFGPDDDDVIIKKAIDDAQSFYETEFPKLYGKQFDPISGGEFPYGPQDPPPNCGKPGTANYQDVAQNAFYCPPGDFVAWDTDNLTNQLLDQFGPFTLAIVVAHELGHAVQARHGILDGRLPTFVTEQQADCFAGAYTKHVQDGGSTAFKVSAEDLDNALGGFLTIRDPVGTDSVNDESAHGSAFQRINAFEDGLTEATEKCKTYEDESFNFVPEVFEPGSLDQAEQGNLPFDEVEPLVTANLEGFWNTAFPEIAKGKEWSQAKIDAFDPATGFKCGDKSVSGNDAVGKYLYCADDDTIHFDEKNLMPQVYSNIGDLAEGAIIGKLYSQRAEKLAGLPTNTIESALKADCFTGVWVATTKTNEVNKTLPDNAVMSLSPGDLDEIVAAFLQFGAKPADVKAGTAHTGTAFQRISAFRTGFFEALNNGLASGLEKCVNTNLESQGSGSSGSGSSGSSASS
jgi:predicted metalloprotease